MYIIGSSYDNLVTFRIINLVF